MQFSYKTEKMVALKKIMLKTAYLSRRRAETLLLLKSSKNLRDSLQTSRKPFSRAISLETAQFYGTQTKTCFSCNIAERSLFKHTRKKRSFDVTQSSNQPQLAANAPKHIFDRLERQKRISCREMWQRLF